MKKLAKLSFSQIEFVKQSFKKLDFQSVEVENDILIVDGKKVKLVGYKRYPEYTNEALTAMQTEELYSIAIMLGFKPQIYHSSNLTQLMETLGDKVTRLKLHSYIYTRDWNHKERIHAVVGNDEVSLTNAIDMANVLANNGVNKKMIERSILSKI